MDPRQLSDLLTQSTDTLTDLHQQLGSSPSDVSASIEALGQALRKAVDSQVEKCQKRVDEIRTECQANQNKIVELQDALREENEMEAEDQNHDEKMPLLQKQALLKSKCLHLEAEHSQRLTESTSIISELQPYIPILGSRVQIPAVKTSKKGKAKASSLIPLPASHLQALRDLIERCSSEVEERTNLLASILREIISLWTDLQDPPVGVTPTNLHSSDAFQESILTSLGLKPIFSTVSSSPSPNKRNSAEQYHHVEYIFEGFVDIDPKEKADVAVDPSDSEDLKPNDEILQKADSLKIVLEETKKNREERIQALYDELEILWGMCEVDSSDIEEFVLENKGSTQSAVEAYEAELLGMQAHKAKFIEVFINRCRETIHELWASLHITEEEQASLFPQLFIDIAEISNEDKERLQLMHEEYIESLKNEFELKEKLFKKMSQWKVVKEEEEQLKISEKDPNRYKNAKAGDMLKEEKARKRIKILKPKLEETLRKEVSNWEKETEREFRYDGVRLLDILGADEKPVPAGSKRARTASTSTDSASVLSASTNSRSSSRVAPTPLRNGRGGIPATPLEGSIVKKQRTASGSAVPSSSVRRANAGGSTAPPVSGMGAKSRLGSHQQPLQAPSFQTPTPRNYTHSSNQSSPSRLPQPKRFASNASSVSAQSGSSKLGFPTTNLLPAPAAKKTFRPRPSQANGCGSSSDPPSSSSDAEPPIKKPKTKARLSMNKLKEALLGPGGGENSTDGKWSEIENHRWPTSHASNETKSSTFQRSISTASSNQSDATTLIHSTDPNKSSVFRKSRRGPSMSLEASLAMMANSKSQSGMPSIRHVSSESLNEKTSGNWAVLDDESGIMDGVMEFGDDDLEDEAREQETKNAFSNDRIEEENESLMF